jgi:hypothetical protein
MSAHARRAAALLLLAAVCAAVLVLPFAPHTDDGCQTEVHCLACRLSVAGHSVAATEASAATALALVGSAATVLRPAPEDGERIAVASRGPPAFA